MPTHYSRHSHVVAQYMDDCCSSSCCWTSGTGRLTPRQLCLRVNKSSRAPYICEPSVTSVRHATNTVYASGLQDRWEAWLLRTAPASHMYCVNVVNTEIGYRTSTLLNNLTLNVEARVGPHAARPRIRRAAVFNAVLRTHNVNRIPHVSAQERHSETALEAERATGGRERLWGAPILLLRVGFDVRGKVRV